MSQQEIQDDRVEWMLKFSVFACGIGLIALGVHKITNFDFDDLKMFALTIYYIIFGFLLCVSVLPFESFYSSFSFLRYYLGKGVFLVFLGSLALDTEEFWYIIIAIILLVVGFVYLLLGLTCAKKITFKLEAPAQQPAATPEEKPLVKTD
ncbi:unnamed protein product [Blepharisma stoltei]|uniref:COPI associated protein n=1 Tax=Blepharisma stoltei TaxID=1481888 RepID=A0AAU9K8F0_9CILI|nr:unnamed protein product [Blepharisma stoltei]